MARLLLTQHKPCLQPVAPRMARSLLRRHESCQRPAHQEDPCGPPPGGPSRV